MSLKDSEQDSSSALENAQAALSQLTFHLTVQKTATEHAAALAEEVRKQLYHATPAPLPSHLPICPIDLEPIERGDARVLACGHVYHAECIEHWLDFSNTCPLDRSIVEEDMDVSSDNASATEDALTAIDGDSTANVPTNASSRTSSITSVGSGTVDMRLVETLAFHHRLIADHEVLVARAEELVFEGTEVDLNVRWAEFLQRQIEGLSVGAVAVEREILGPDGNAYGHNAGNDDADDEAELLEV